VRCIVSSHETWAARRDDLGARSCPCNRRIFGLHPGTSRREPVEVCTVVGAWEDGMTSRDREGADAEVGTTKSETRMTKADW